ncbi:branched-chain amino acid transaminase [Rickettsia endosymbiont of Culicoides newsteadi]|uniref:branched-chain amino acid transaminase n=1 Tax=Rickettsia endosymbiont of Culicoides newsteadi TaxID=1961830 RepID=UPI000B9AF87B|nr:branched-chain amino acid transaminase [Rickettsia endosymbiont of Culicoides newsteadi]OZG31574.1 branched chain amino acid aminotransferase [Rickettsia endosymbiont of Culicoides newsteadi]
MTIIQENILTEKPFKNLNQLSGYIWINGRFIAWQEAKIHALTHSLHYSGGVFEGEKAYNGKIFKLEEHTQRLIESAKSLSIEVPYSFEKIIEAHQLLITKNNIKDAYIRPLIWFGSESLNLINVNLSVNLLIAAVPSTLRPSGALSLHIARWRKCHPNSLPPQCKSSGHYNMMIVCQKEAKSLGYDDAILLDWRGYVAECSTANIFFVKDDQLFTPIADSFLNGITRQTIIKLANDLNIKVIEEYITPDRVGEFNECFMTGTAVEVKGIKSINLGERNVIFEDSKITNLLKKEYNDLVYK